MKKIFTLLYILFITATAYAQNTFAPAGSEWYHDMGEYNMGIFHSYYAGDTTIQNIPCRRVKQIAQTNPYYSLQGLTVNNNQDIFFYNNADTVFLYNDLANHFTPIYIFNVAEGDTITLPSYSGFGAPNETFTFRVDSVRIALYDTVHLKTVYTTMLSTGIFSYGGSYAERLGAKNALWNCVGCVQLEDERAQSEGGMRCYGDPTMSVKLTQGNCDLYPENVPSLQQVSINIYPNPAHNAINITCNNTKPLTCKLINMAGQVVINTVTTKATTTLNTSLLPAGIYLLQTIAADGSAAYHKISIK